jgi:EpsI family protein
MAELPFPTQSDEPSSEASTFSRRNMLVGGALLATAAAGFVRMPEPVAPTLDKEYFEKRVPKHFGPWNFLTASGLVLPPSEDTTAGIYDQVFTRIYSSAGRPYVTLLIAYSSVQSGLIQLHRPEICYPASGYALSRTEVQQLPLDGGRSIPFRAFEARGSSRSEFVTYWTRLGEHFPVSWIDQRVAVAKANLRKEIPDGILVRLSLIGPQEAGGLDKAKAELSLFVHALLGSLDPQTRRLMIGASG